MHTTYTWPAKSITESYAIGDSGDIPDDLVILHTLGTVGNCLPCVSKHLQSLAQKNCNYKLKMQFPLCAVLGRGGAYKDPKDIKIFETKYRLQLQACMRGESLHNIITSEIEFIGPETRIPLL